MTQEDKKQLLVDLSARLPYHVRLKVWLKDGTIEEGFLDLEHNYADVLRDAFYYNEIKDIKPYLRPMPSMTEKEKGHVKDIIDEFADRWLDSDVAKDKWDATFWQCSEIVNYLNSIHIDYRGLIEKGLALEAPEGMYVKEEQQ